MANSRSARKRIRSNERKKVRNRAVRASVRTTVGKARRALLGAGADAEEQVKMAVRALDRAAEKGIIHPNNSRRRKSRLASMASRLARAEGGEAGEKAARSVAAGGTKGRSTRAAAVRKPAAKAAAAGKTAAKPAGRAPVASSSKATRSARPPRGKTAPDGQS